MTTWHGQGTRGGDPTLVIIGEASGSKLLASLLYVAAGTTEATATLTDKRTGSTIRVRLPTDALEQVTDVRAMNITMEVLQG